MTKAAIRNNLVLELHVPDFRPARKFYGLLGFTEQQYDASSGGGSDLGYLVLKRDDHMGTTMLNFYGDKPSVAQHAHFKEFSSDTPRGYGVEITIPVNDVTSMWQSISPKLNDKAIAQPLERKRWGDQDFRLIDPYGFYIRFTEIVDWGQK